MRVSREKLYAEVWAEPMTTVAKRYEVSSNYLARICERLNVPRPGRGYWAQRAVGAEVEADPLPEPEPGDEIEWTRDGSTPAIVPMSSKAPRTRKTSIADKHPLLVGARAHFDEVRPGGEKLYVLPRKTKLVDVFVTPATLDRALKFASGLFNYLEDRGQRIVFAPVGREYSRPELDVREGSKPQYDYGGYDRGRWQKQRKESEEREKRWRREEEERRRKEEEAARIKQIGEDIASWRLARDIRGYVGESRAPRPCTKGPVLSFQTQNGGVHIWRHHQARISRC